ncbi:MAG TPA: IS1380 family transposase [Hanamia sp.]
MKVQISENKQPVLFNISPVKNKEVALSFTGSDISSDGGLLLLKECEGQVGIIKSLTNCLADQRHPSYIHHSLEQMITQRVFQIAAGYEDADDCDSLRTDDIFKLCSGKLPSDGALASQPTMSRFEHTPSRSELYRMCESIMDGFISSYACEPGVIVLDCDDTNSNTYGNQQLTLYNDYYGEHCYMPLHIYEGLSGKLITTILKPGRRSKNINVFAILSRIVKKIRSRWKQTMIIIRGDGHFCNRQLMDWIAGIGNVHFLTGLTGNSVLNKLAAVTIKSAEDKYKRTGKPVKFYHSFEYKAGEWKNAQRVIVKVEMNDKGKNVRYVVTDMRDARTKSLYEQVYCARGGMELRIKEHKTYLQSDRMSCTKFGANQFRLFLHSAAYILLHNLQTEVLRTTQYAKSTFKTIREKIIKVAAYVKEMKTKIKIELPQSYPEIALFNHSLLLFEALRT